MACCPGHASKQSKGDFVWHAPESAEATYTPAWSASFNEVNVKTKLDDGYWIEAFPFRTPSTLPEDPDRPKTDAELEGPRGPELIAYGLGVTGKKSQVKMYLNPLHEMKNQIAPPNEWEHTVVKEFDFPVAVTYGRLRSKPGVDLNDIIICHDYGASMDNLNMDGGIVSWLKNPGDRKQGNWAIHEIGRFPSMHRLKTGYFTQNKHIEILALPIMTKSKDRETPAPVIIYKQADWDTNDGSPTQWTTHKVLPDTFRLIHDVQVIHSTDGGLDKALVAGREGISMMWMDEKTEVWQHSNVGTGIPQSRRPFANPYWGSGSVATARVGNDSVGYIASCEAFHGNLVSIYVKPRGTRPDNIVTGEHWRRFVIDDFGPLKEEEFTGTIHHVQCADLDGSGVDSIIVACMGYPQNQGTYVYKPIDLERGLFSRFKISDGSAGRIAVADYRCSGTLDVATITYSVPGYHEIKDPAQRAVRIMHNNTSYTRRAIRTQLLEDEVMIRVPRAVSATFTSEIPFLDIGGKLLSLVVLPPYREYLLGKGKKYQGKYYDADGVKVINGDLTWESSSGKTVTRGIAVDRYKSECMIPDITSGIVKACDKGAIFIRIASSIDTATPGLKFDNMADVATVNRLPSNADPAARDVTFPWVRCSDRPWGKGKFDWPFYNAVGFHVLYDDDSLTNFCHIQAWTLGQGQTAAFHNHDDNAFCEIHACISNGTGKGGMWWGRDRDADKFLGNNKEEKNPDVLAKYADNVVVGDMEEHGPLWRYNEEKLPMMRPNATVDYPYHAWLAGPKDPNVKEAFDVWLAFEFPPSQFQQRMTKHIGCAACH
ncbi:hypothetical protein BDV93DRAFT_558972 [Ceratobasidium sp. AG-I]|nr:hypothetical protein BDV93DRAFT_558972 [Ceratobasidium sp. AG-I]